MKRCLGYGMVGVLLVLDVHIQVFLLVFTRYSSVVSDGQRFENILWRLWYKVLLGSDEELNAKVHRPPASDGTSRPFGKL